MASSSSTIGELIDGSNASIKTGPFGTKLKSSEYGRIGAPVISVGEIGNGRIKLHAKTPRVSDEVISRMPEYLLQEGDIVFARKGGVERSAIIQANEAGYFLGSDGIRLRLGGTCDPRFIAYQLLTEQHKNWMLQNAGGTTMPSLNEGIIRRIPILLPLLDDQKRIAGILGSLDDKIELNLKMNETLEQMAHALFKSWFVDFDPVLAKIAGRQPAGMGKADADLFPDSLVDTEMGKIPKGWRIKSVDEISTVGIGKTPPRKEKQWFSEDQMDIPWVSIRDLGSSGVFISSTSEFLTKKAVDRFRIKRIPDNTVLLSFKLTVGRVAITRGEMLSNEAIAHFNLNEDSPFGSPYLYCYLKNFNYDQLGSTSSIATAVNSETIRNIAILIPSQAACSLFEDKVEHIFSQIKNNQEQCVTLHEIRNSLLPRLLSGGFTDLKK